MAPFYCDLNSIKSNKNNGLCHISLPVPRPFSDHMRPRVSKARASFSRRLQGMVGDVVFGKLLALGDVCGRALPVESWPPKNLDKRLTP